MKQIVTFLIFLSNVILISSYNPCCQGKNVVRNKTCVDGTSMKELACEKQIIVKVQDFGDAYVDQQNYLIFADGDAIPPDEFCFTTLAKKNHTDVYVLCYEEDEEIWEENMKLNVALSYISVVFTILTVAIYLSLPELLDTQGICLVHSMTGLAFSYTLLGIVNLSSKISEEYCHFLAYLMYTSFLYAFFWLHILAFYIWKGIVKPQILKFTKRWLLIYHIFGISGPVLLLIFLLTANYSKLSYFDDIHPGIGENKCWFKDRTGTFIYFYGPISVLLAINLVYFVWTIIALWGQVAKMSEQKAKVHKYRFFLCIKLFFIMGITWCFEVVSGVLENTSRWIWVLPDALNALQGFLIFLILVVFRKKVIRALANKKIFRSIRLPASWKNAQDDECEELDEEISLSSVERKNTVDVS